MYDVIVLGGGPGGYAAGIRAAQLGGKVAVIESREIGGTCVNRGCIPSKVWLKAAQIKEAIEKAEEFGLKASLEGVDFSVIAARKEAVSGDIRMGMNGLLGNNNIDVIEGKGLITSPGSVSVNGETLETKSIIIATGASAGAPDMPGLADVQLTTDQIFDMENVPESVLIYGAGYVEVEMASILNAFGAKVTLAFDSPRLMTGEDSDLTQRLSMGLRGKGIDIIPGVTLDSVKSAGKGCEVSLSGKKGQDLSIERVLCQIHKPNTGEIGIDGAGIELKENGFVNVDDHLKTSAEGVYAIGDVTGGTMLSYAATVMGVTAAENAMGMDSVFPSHLVPRCLSTVPEAAAVGLSEDEAEKQGHEVETGVFPMSINGLAIVHGETDGAVKIVSDAEYGEVLGVHIVGCRATELIWGASLALQMEATAEDLAKTIVVHPTFSESIAMAAQDAMGWALYLPKR